MKITTILVVDDQPEYLKTYATLFFEEQVPYKIISALNGKMALELARSEHPDVIIMDWQMPEMDGLTALKQLKKDPDLREIPVIMASGIMLESSDLKKALEAGASDYIRKPIDRTELLARTHSHIRLAGYMKTIREQEQALLRERDNRIDLLTESSFALSNQISEMVRVFINEHEKMIAAIHNLRKKRKFRAGNNRFHSSKPHTKPAGIQTLSGSRTTACKGRPLYQATFNETSFPSSL